MIEMRSSRRTLVVVCWQLFGPAFILLPTLFILHHNCFVFDFSPPLFSLLRVLLLPSIRVGIFLLVLLLFTSTMRWKISLHASLQTASANDLLTYLPFFYHSYALLVAVSRSAAWWDNALRSLWLAVAVFDITLGCRHYDASLSLGCCGCCCCTFVVSHRLQQRQLIKFCRNASMHFFIPKQNMFVFYF